MKIFFSIFILFLFIFQQAQSQSLRKISGSVYDAATEKTLAGATITDGRHSVVSDKEGLFTINTSESEIAVSFVGYKTQHINIANSSDIIVKLINNVSALNAVVVTGFETNRSLFQTAGAISVLNKTELDRGNQTSILSALNTIPGVKMEEEAPGDYKISLRGSALRDAYGVRNLKMYWEGIPITSPDNSGSHSLNIDPSQLGSIEVIKGPAGSIYGAGMGGVILFRNDKASFDENSLGTTTTFGSFGLFKSSTTYKMNNEKMLLTANYSHLNYNGYRENEGSENDAADLLAKFYISDKQTISFIMIHSSGNYGIAGSVDSARAMTQPRKAVQYAIDNKTGVRKHTFTLAGVSQVYKLNDKISNTTSIFTDFQTLDHPYGQSIFYNGFLIQSVGGYGARTHFTFSKKLGEIKTKFIVGDEVQYENRLAGTYDIDNAEPGKMQSNNQVGMLSNIAFAQASLDFPKGTFLTVGASINNLKYDVTDLIQQSATHENASGNLNFTTTVSPRIALVKTFNKKLAVHASASYGFSPPSMSETNNPDGTFNKNIRAEHGINYEVGVRGSLADNKLNFDISGYQMNLVDAILPSYNQYGGQSYRNSGNTTQRGIEASLYYEAINRETGFVTRLKPWINYAYSNYHFKNYVKESFDYGSDEVIKKDISGNKVTGVSPDMINAGVDIETSKGFYFNTVLNYVSKTPINDLNTYYQHGYTLLAAKIGYHIPVGKIGIDVFAGGSNLLNQKYSSWVSFNADANSFPPQFFNPSPTANFYGGVSLKYDFNSIK